METRRAEVIFLDVYVSLSLYNHWMMKAEHFIQTRLAVFFNAFVSY